MSKPGYLNFRVDPEQLQQLERLARAKGYKISQFARMCLRSGLKLAPDFPTKQTEHEVKAKAAA